MSRRIYAVEVENIGSVQVSRDSIGEAREWAKQAFGRGASRVSPVVSKRPPCPGCDSRPCLCRDRRHS